MYTSTPVKPPQPINYFFEATSLVHTIRNMQKAYDNVRILFFAAEALLRTEEKVRVFAQLLCWLSLPRATAAHIAIQLKAEVF